MYISEVGIQRTVNYIKQVKLSLLMRLLTIAISFLITGLMVRQLSLEIYGIWSIIISVQIWISFFDLGIGNGLKTKLAQALSKKNYEEAGSLITLAYKVFASIFVVLIVVSMPIIFFLDWQILLNARFIGPGELTLALVISVVLTSLVFVSNLINPIAAAFQKSSYGTVVGLVNASIFFFVLLSLKNMGQVTLVNILFAQGVVNIIVNIAFTYWFLRTRGKLVISKQKKIGGARNLMSVSGGYILIQISMLVLFSTDKLIITHLIGPESVAEYDVVFKLFSVLITAHLMIAGPLWAAYTEAHTLKEIDWIKSTLCKQLKILGLLSIGSCVLALLAKWIIDYWTGSKIMPQVEVILGMAFFSIVVMWNNTFGALLNGVGKLKVQIYSTAVGAMVNIPLSIYFVNRLGMGVDGVIYATILSLCVQAVFLPVAVKKLLKI